MAVKAKASVTISHLIDISSVTRYYLLQSSTSAAPAKPTTNPPSSSWTKTEPSYTTGSTNTLYFVDCTEFTNGTFKYSEVSKSSSYEAAKAAYNKAAAVETRVTSAETAINQNKEAISLRATKTEVTTAINDIKVGGRNYILNSVFEKPLLEAYDSGESGWAEPIGSTSVTIDNTVLHNGHNTLHKQCTYVNDDTWYESNYYFANDRCIQFSPNETWTLSLWIYAKVIPTEPLLTSIRLFNTNWLWASKVCEIDIGEIVATEVNKWERVEITFNTPATIPTYDRGYIMFTTEQTTNCYMTEFKLEKGNKATDWTPAPEDVDVNIDDTAKDIQRIISDQSKTTIESCNDNIDNALKKYVPVSDYEEYKKTVVTTSQLTQTSDDLKLDFQSRITETNDDMIARFTELSKYFRFSDDGIEIGSEQNSLKLILDNDLIRFEKNGESVGWWDGVDFHTGNIMVDVTERAQFGNFAFIPRTNGSLMFVKVDNTASGNIFNVRECSQETNVKYYNAIGITGAVVYMNATTSAALYFELTPTKKYRIKYTSSNTSFSGTDADGNHIVDITSDGVQQYTFGGVSICYFYATDASKLKYTFRDVKLVEVG